MNVHKEVCAMPIPIYESAEDYLEAILIIQQEKGVAHSIDIAEHLHFSKASVSVAMKKLRENGNRGKDLRKTPGADRLLCHDRS